MRIREREMEIERDRDRDKDKDKDTEKESQREREREKKTRGGGGGGCRGRERVSAQIGSCFPSTLTAIYPLTLLLLLLLLLSADEHNLIAQANTTNCHRFDRSICEMSFHAQLRIIMLITSADS